MKAFTNPEEAWRMALLKGRPGRLIVILSPRAEATLKGLLQPRLARRCIEEATNDPRRLMAPELGLALQDGGLPVDGIAHAIDPGDWRRVARTFLLT